MYPIDSSHCNITSITAHVQILIIARHLKVKGHAHALNAAMPRAFYLRILRMADRSSDEEFADIASFDAKKLEVSNLKEPFSSKLCRWTTY